MNERLYPAPETSLLRANSAGSGVPAPLPATPDAVRLLCRTCARLLPRGDLPFEIPPRFTHILIATDGSQRGEDAAALGVALARHSLATVVFLHATMPWRGGTWIARLLSAADVTVDPRALSFSEGCLERARVLAMNAGVRFETRLAYDPRPDRAILDAARETACDLIVLGSRGGRIARRVSTHARVPVLICPTRS